MAAYLRAQDVRTILDFGFTKSMPIDEVASVSRLRARGAGEASGRDLRQLAADRSAHGQCAAPTSFGAACGASKGFIGICVSAPGMGYPASDPIYDPFYEVCIELDRPVLVLVGYTGSGAGLPGGGGVLARPVASALRRRAVGALSEPQDHRRPQPVAMAGRHDRRDAAQAERLAGVSRLVAEIHSRDSLKHEIPRRLKHSVMFGADYPLFTLRAAGHGLAGARLRRGDAACGCSPTTRAAVPRRWRTAERGSFAARQGRDRRRRKPGHRLRDRASARGRGRATSRWWRADASRSTPRSARSPQQGGDARSPSPPTSARPRTASASSPSATAAFGRLDILVNNDGAPPLGKLDEFDDDAWAKAVEQNLMSVVRLTRHALAAYALERAADRIVNITALSVLQPMPRFGLSVATWAGVFGYAKTLSLEVAAERITVNTICPGRIATGRLDKVFGAGSGTRPPTTRRGPTWRSRSRWGAWARPTRSPGWSRSWHRRGERTSPGPCFTSTAGAAPA